MNKKIAIVTGEPNSVNSEIISKSWLKNKSIFKKCFLIGNFSLIQNQIKRLKFKIPMKKISDLDNIDSSKKIKIFNIPIKFKNSFNVSDSESKKYIKKSLKLAHNLSKRKDIFGFINCPIDKKRSFKLKNFGVTDYLAKANKTNGTEAMLIYNKNLGVVPITTHISVKKISRTLSKELLIKKIKTINEFYMKFLRQKPIIAVLGLNPHNDEMSKNSEEKKIIIPAIKKLLENKIKVIGPYPADTIFSNKSKYKFDVIVGMYHDQVLAPFKALYNFNAINITIGLKYIRVSPDHGIAKDLIGKKIANPQSFIKTVEFLNKIKNV
ncbi:MAG: 4-hydroxythreonine-4-phosphate dehydrogenase PdxA [Pelagibacteraceae bacterium]